ncbi:MAG: hypothetical protein DMD67_06605 [Gemmatimonadetes bacterium]|nr:MAG: hypothetical protein DMD67_06605 [Gemmatimonadota bacterium]
MAPMTTAARPPLGRSLLRLFTVQGSWNYERMQGIGMGVAEQPLIRDLEGNGTAYRAAVARAAHFFNAHPYLCGLAVGATARAEHDATADFGARAHRGGARARPLGDLRFPDRVQHRSRRIAVVGAAGRLGVRRAGRNGAA